MGKTGQCVHGGRSGTVLGVKTGNSVRGAAQGRHASPLERVLRRRWQERGRSPTSGLSRRRRSITGASCTARRLVLLAFSRGISYRPHHTFPTTSPSRLRGGGQGEGQIYAITRLTSARPSISSESGHVMGVILDADDAGIADCLERAQRGLNRTMPLP